MKNKNVIILTERCVLAQFNERDLDEAIKLFTCDRVRLYLGGTITEAQARNKLNGWIDRRSDLCLSVRLRDTGRFIGILSVSSYHDSGFKELSYQLLPEFWGIGLAYEAINAFLKQIRESKQYSDLIAETQTCNVRSCKLLEKLGFELLRIVNRFDAQQSVYKIALT